jgi:hypothetical protein
MKCFWTLLLLGLLVPGHCPAQMSEAGTSLEDSPTGGPSVVNANTESLKAGPELALPHFAARAPVLAESAAAAPTFECSTVLSASPAAGERKASAAKPQLWAGDPKRFFEGAFVAFVNHETGHLITNTYFDTDPFLKSVHYGFIPFFTIEPGRYVTRHEHYAIAASGFTAQNLLSEWLLTKHSDLAEDDEPFLKGLGMFNFWLGVGYAATAFAGSGPHERDTKGMADALGWDERAVGAMVLAPTLLDMYRYRHPECKWARTASRIGKLLIMGLMFRHY